jgi:hypothetical protein
MAQTGFVFIVGGTKGQLTAEFLGELLFEPDGGLIVYALVSGHEAQDFTELILWRLLHPHQEPARAIRLGPMLDISIQFLPATEVEIAYAEISPVREAQGTLKRGQEGLVDVVKDLRHSWIPVSSCEGGGVVLAKNN